MSKVIIISGSPADKDHAKKIKNELSKFNVEIVEYIASAHKVPEKVLGIINQYNESSDNLCYVTIAGRSNGLSGVTAANSIHPVIACPPFGDKADYLVNIHSSVQMPSGTPAMVVVDPKNAAAAVVKILALNDSELKVQVSDGIKATKEGFSTEPISA